MQPQLSQHLHPHGQRSRPRHSATNTAVHLLYSSRTASLCEVISWYSSVHCVRTGQQHNSFYIRRRAKNQPKTMTPGIDSCVIPRSRQCCERLNARRGSTNLARGRAGRLSCVPGEATWCLAGSLRHRSYPLRHGGEGGNDDKFENAIVEPTNCLT